MLKYIINCSSLCIISLVYFDLGAPTSTSDSIQDMSRKSFGPWYEPDKYKWTPDLANEYDGGGYMVYFPMDTEKAQLKIAELKKELFLDKSTRSIVLVSSFFNVCFVLSLMKYKRNFTCFNSTSKGKFKDICINQISH